MPFCPHCRLFFGEYDDIDSLCKCGHPRMCCEEEECNPEEERLENKLELGFSRLIDAGYSTNDIRMIIQKNKNPDLRD
jgi:hypothetical protein